MVRQLLATFQGRDVKKMLVKEMRYGNMAFTPDVGHICDRLVTNE